MCTSFTWGYDTWYYFCRYLSKGFVLQCGGIPCTKGVDRLKFDRSSTLYSTLLLTGTGLFSQMLGFFYRIALSRMIGAEVMGLYQLVMPVYYLLLSVVSSGLSTAVSTLSAEYHALRRPHAIRAALSRCLGVFFLMAAAIGSTTALFSDFISVYLLGDARTQLSLILIAPCLMLTGVENLHKHVFYGSGNVRPAALTELCEQIIRTCAVLGLLWLFLPQYPERIVGLIVCGMIVSEIFSSTTLVILLRVHMGRKSRSPVPPPSAGRIASIAVPVGLTALLNNLMGSATSVMIPQRLVVGGMAVSEAMSAFGVLCGMTIPLLSMPTALMGAMCLIMVPKLAESAALGDKISIQRRLDRALNATSVILMPATALLVVIGPTLGQLLYKEPTVGRFMLPLAVGLLLSCYQGVLASALNGINRQNAAARNAIICNGVELILTWYTVAIPHVGLLGYVFAFLVSAALGLALNVISTVRATGLPLHWRRWLLAPTAAALFSALWINLLFRLLERNAAPPILSVLLCLALGGMLYLLALRVQGVRLRKLFHMGK